MSDDLVKRLRKSWDEDRSIISQTGQWMTERVAAADHIEELEANALANRVAIMRLEAKLAKVVEAADAMAVAIEGQIDIYDASEDEVVALHNYCTTLVKLKGQDQ